MSRQLLERVFAQLGGLDRSVTLSALRTALAQALESPLQEADHVLEVAHQLGMVKIRGQVAKLLTHKSLDPETGPGGPADSAG